MLDFRTLAAKTLENEPDKLVVIHDERSLTYAEFDARVQRHAEALIALGIRRGDRVGLFSHNQPMVAALLFACWEIGAVALPLNHRYKGAEVAYALERSGTRILLAQNGLAEPLVGSMTRPPKLEHMFAFEDTIDGFGESWRGFVEQGHPPVGNQTKDPRDPAVIYYTSGSTGKPKGVTHTQKSVHATAASRCTTVDYDTDEVWIVATQLVHASGSLGSLVPCVRVGGTAILLEDFSAKAYLDAVAKHRPTRSLLLPSLLRDVLEHPQSDTTDLSSLRSIECGGDIVTKDLFERWSELSDAPLMQLLGMTECEGYCSMREFNPAKIGSAGRPRDGVEVCVVDKEGAPLPAGAIGELLLRSDSMMSYYWNDEANTTKTIRDGWLYTSDEGKIDEDGDVWFVGRDKEIIIRRGSNIAPGEVECVLDVHPSISRGVVVGVKDKALGQKVVAFLQLVSDTTIEIDALRIWMLESLADYKVPEEWVIMDELPRNAVGKLDRTSLHKLANERFGSS